MINKNVYMIWFGNIPDYIKKTYDTYRKINFDCNIEFLDYSIEHIEDLYRTENNLYDNDLILKKSINLAIKQLINGKKMPIIPRISFYYRQFIINKYGGIYLDCDTFPIRPFDDELFNYDYFITSRKVHNRSFIFVDNCFFGHIPSVNIDSVYSECKEYQLNSKYKILCPLFEDSMNYDLCRKFYECNLEYGNYYGNIKYNYIDHYTLWKWNPNKCQIPKTTMDDDIDKIKQYNIKWSLNG